MNYANMIEEKNLKKTFIVATLCSTLVGTFTSSIGLYDRLAERRRQNKKDDKQNEEIKKLQDKIDASEKRSKEKIDELEKRRQPPPRDELPSSFERSGAMIMREYDEGYERLGRRFAVGDAITENQLQAQIISLQQTVIHILQDALINDRVITRSDMAKILSASQAAREGSLDALRQQYERLSGSQAGGSQAGGPQRALPAPKRASTVVDMDADSVFCRYSLDLQYIPHKPLSANFAPGGQCRCPACGVRLNVSSDDFWQIGKRVPILVADGRGYEKEILEEREFHLGQRFIVKCHTVDGEYACVLCNKHRDVDIVCGTVETLVNHVGNKHGIEELEQEIDLWEDRGGERRGQVEKRLSLPAPRAPSPPVVQAPREVSEARYERRLVPEYR